MVLNKSPRYEAVRAQPVWTLLPAVKLRLFGLAVSSPVTIPTALSCLCFHVTNTFGIRLDSFDGRIPHGPIRTTTEIRTRDPSVRAVTRNR